MTRDASLANHAPRDDAAFIVKGGETGALIRSLDWEATPLGPARDWPQSLRTAINICVSSRFPIALYWGPEFVMLYNDDLLPMVGANKHPRAMGRPAFEVLPEIRDVIEPMLQRVVRTGEPIWSEDLMLPLLRSDAQAESYFTFTYSPIRDESGGVGGVFCAVLETTDKVIEERRLRLLNALADATGARTPADACALAAAQLARAASDVPFALLYLLDEASATARLAGAANIEPGTPHAPTAIAVGDRSTWAFDPSASSCATRSIALELGPGGARGAVMLPIVRSGGGRPLGFIVAGLSPLLRSSASYDRFHNLLSASISQGVSNAAAYEAERQRAEALAKLDRAKTTFFSNVSHEFRTPLTLMLAPIQDMMALPPGAAIDHASVELLHRNALRLLKLVNTLLEFSRIEAGRVDAAYQPVDLSALTIDLASSFRAAIERAGLSLDVDCPALPEPVYVDRDMWEKIVLNLLSNAFKFTFEGSIAVRLRSDDAAVRLEVEDTGTGIAEQDVPRLFERFHRIEGARSRSHEGSGIGLALIQELVQLHGGAVRVASTLGAGTLFEVRIPRGTAHLAKELIRASRTLSSTAVGAEAFVHEVARWGAPAVDVRAPDPAPRAPAPRERILFADDNADMREYVARLLGERWTVATVQDGAEALAAIRRDPPDLVLCDVMMPGLDGFALVRALRSDPALCAIPIIILSARAGEHEAAKGLSSGANDYIAKPFSARDLLVRVASNLATARAAEDMRARERVHREAAEAAAQAQRQVREFQERFVAVLGHDLRNPIAAIDMATGLLGQRAAQANDTATTRVLARLASSNRRMMRMVEQILDLSRSRIGGGLEVSPAPMDLHVTLTAVIDELRTANPSRTITLACPSIHGTWDHDRLEQVFSNLIGNAVHHGLATTPVTVQAHDDAETIHVDVHNEGPPIPETVRATLFDPFRRGDRESRGAGTAGLGLGLYISGQLVAAHGGAIDLQSSAADGTTFRVTLPRTATTATGKGRAR